MRAGSYAKTDGTRIAVVGGRTETIESTVTGSALIAELTPPLRKQINQGRRALVATGLSANSAQKQIEVRDGLRPEDATKAACDALACRYGNGPITGRIRAITATG